jgi:hypothetical protein
MFDRVAYGYVRLLFALESLHFPASLLLHLSMIFGVKAYCSEWPRNFVWRGWWVDPLVGCGSRFYRARNLADRIGKKMRKLRRAFLLTNAPSHGSLLRLSKYRAFQQEAGENSKGIPQAGKNRVVGKKRC